MLVIGRNNFGVGGGASIFKENQTNARISHKIIEINNKRLQN